MALMHHVWMVWHCLQEVQFGKNLGVENVVLPSVAIARDPSAQEKIRVFPITPSSTRTMLDALQSALLI